MLLLSAGTQQKRCYQACGVFREPPPTPSRRATEVRRGTHQNIHKYRLKKVLSAIQDQIVKAQRVTVEQMATATTKVDKGAPAKRKLEEALDNEVTGATQTQTSQCLVPVGEGSQGPPPTMVARLTGTGTRNMHTYKPTPY